MNVVVAGAGIIGCAAAFELSRRGFDVQVFDPREAGGGATQATAGVLAPFIEAPSPGPLLELSLGSFHQYERFVEAVQAASGVPIEFRRCGTFELAPTSEDEERLRRVAELARAVGFVAEWRVRDDGSRGLLIPSQGYVRVEQLMAGLRRGAERRGVRFHQGVAVEHVEGSAERVTFDEGGRASSCEALVVAAGSWSNSVDPGIPAIRPVRGQLLRLHRRGDPLPYVLWSHDCYLVPWADGTLLVGATVEDVGFDERVTAEGVGGLLAAALRLRPELADATFLEARCGLRPASIDGLPVIRPSDRSPRIIHATGHYRNGILLAPLTSERVADLVASLRS